MVSSGLGRALVIIFIHLSYSCLFFFDIWQLYILLYEIGVIEAFLPAQMNSDELQKLVASLVTKSGAQGMQDMGKVMGLLKSEGQGRVDMGKASALVKAQLASL